MMRNETMLLISVLAPVFIVSSCYGIAGAASVPAKIISSVDSTINHVIKKRASFYNPPNKAYQECITPTGAQGHCKYFQHCTIPDVKDNFLRIFGYLCVIEQTSIGLCCQDNKSPTTDSRGDSILFNGHAEDTTNIETDESGKIVNKPENRGCGIATKQFPKIAAGRPAEPEEWPWMAALMLRGRPHAYCGGALVTDQLVLTAAHCTNPFEIENIYVRLGEYDFQGFNETRSRDFPVVSVRQHIDFNPATYENDIALLKLNRATIFNTYIWPVCMPPLGESWDGWMGVVTGWGTISFGGPHSNVLMEVSVPIWSQDRCRQAFTHRIPDTFLCAGDDEGGRDSCQGDSGGPLLVKLPNNRWAVVGIVSWGLKCGNKHHPGVYTRVNNYMTWIVENSLF